MRPDETPVLTARSPSRRATRLGVRAGAAALAAVAVVTLLAGPDDNGSADVGVGPGSATPLTTSVAGAAPPAGGASPPGQAGRSPASALPSTPGAGSATGATNQPGRTSPPPTRPGGGPDPAPDDGVAILSPTIAMMRFGSQVGLPLLCGVVLSGLTNGIPDPTLAELAGEISRTCGQLSSYGVEGADALNANLAALAAANPAVGPVINELATVVEKAPSGPFGGFFMQLAALVRFFT